MIYIDGYLHQHDGGDRYARLLALDEIGEPGLATLQRSSVLVFGAGGVGSACLMHLAASGVGTIGIVDGDTVAESNLPRQLIYRTDDVGSLKVKAAANHLRAMNPGIEIKTAPVFADEAFALGVARDYDFIIDAVDGLPTKKMIGRSAERAGKPHCHAAIGQFRGQVMTCLPGGNDAFSRVFSPEKTDTGAEQPDSGEQTYCSGVEHGVLGMACDIAGSIEALEAVKYLVGIENLITDAVLYFDLRTYTFRKIQIA